MRIIKLILCFYLPILLYLTNRFIVGPFGVYQRWEWFDIPMHIIGGCLIVYSLILFLRELDKEIIIKNRLLEILIIIGLLSIIMICWEFYQYIMHIILNVNQNTLKDTLSDFMFGLIGGLVVALKMKLKMLPLLSD